MAPQHCILISLSQLFSPQNKSVVPPSALVEPFPLSMFRPTHCGKNAEWMFRLWYKVVSFSISYFLNFLFVCCFFLPVTWMTVRSLKFQRTVWTREPSRSGLNALSCWKFWVKAVMGRWDPLAWSCQHEFESFTTHSHIRAHSCKYIFHF